LQAVRCGARGGFFHGARLSRKIKNKDGVIFVAVLKKAQAATRAKNCW
jgi:hypothetical protein